MPGTRPPYSFGFHRQLIDLVRAGRDPIDLARAFEPTARSIRHRVAVADRQKSLCEQEGPGLAVAGA